MGSNDSRYRTFLMASLTESEWAAIKKYKELQDLAKQLNGKGIMAYVHERQQDNMIPTQWVLELEVER